MNIKVFQIPLFIFVVGIVFVKIHRIYHLRIAEQEPLPNGHLTQIEM